MLIYIYIGNVLFGTRASKLGNGMGQFLRSSMGDMFMPSIYYKAKKIVTCDMRRCWKSEKHQGTFLVLQTDDFVMSEHIWLIHHDSYSIWWFEISWFDDWDTCQSRLWSLKHVKAINHERDSWLVRDSGEFETFWNGWTWICRFQNVSDII